MRKATPITLTTLTLVAAAALLHTACGNDAPPKDSFPALGQPPAINLVEAGAEPRRELRWHAQAGQSGGLKMKVAVTMDSGPTGKVEMPMEMVFGTKVEDVMADGRMRVSFDTTDASLQMPGMPAEAGDMVRDLMRGMKISATMDPQGRLTDSNVELGDSALARQMKPLMGNLDQSIDQLAVPFPSEPVGAGAKWDALVTAEMNGVEMRMQTKYELVKVDGDRVELKIQVRQWADSQSMESPAMAGATVEIGSMKGEGTSKIVLDLGKPLVLTLEGEVKSEMDMTVKMGSQSQSLDMKSTARITATPIEGGGSPLNQ